MDRDGSVDSISYLRMALPVMSEHDVPVYPRNYAVWYEYVSGTNLPLKQAIDEHIKHNRLFTDEFNEKLYMEHIAETDEINLRNLQRDLVMAVLAVQGNLSTADNSSVQFGDALKKQAQLLSDNPGGETVQSIVKALKTELGTMQDSTRTLQQGLKENSKEIERLRKELDSAKHEASLDPFTGLANRRSLIKNLEEAIQRSQEEGHEIGFLMLDIDHFKLINDTHGHLMGDKVIRCVANIIKNSVKGNDLVARYGGEEFAVLLPNTPHAGAMVVAENIRQSIERTNLVRSSDKQPIGRVTISIGVASYRSPETSEEFIERADKFLYQSKSEGRNRVSGEK